MNELVELMKTYGKIFALIRFDMLLQIIVNLIVIIILFKLTDLFINKLLIKAKKSESASLSGPLIPILSRTIKFLILFFVIVSFLQTNGYSITSLIAGFGITGLAVGFAAQQTVADFFGTLTIITDKMYKLGDYVKINDVEGTVEDINLLSTKIRTLDDFLVFIPNNAVSSAVITNITRANKRRINEVFTVTYGTSDENLQKAIQIIKDVCAENKFIYDDVNVFVETLSSSSIDIRLWAYVKTKSVAEFVQIRSEIILKIVEIFRNENIDFAFPSQSVYIEKNED